MRPLAHFLAVILLIPQMLVFTAFVILGHITGGHTLGSFFERAFDLLNILFGWGGLAVIVTTIVILAAGFSERWRPIAAGVLIALAAGTTIWLAVQLWPPAELWDLLVFAPAVLSVALSALSMRSVATAVPAQPSPL